MTGRTKRWAEGAKRTDDGRRSGVDAVLAPYVQGTDPEHPAGPLTEQRVAQTARDAALAVQPLLGEPLRSLHRIRGLIVPALVCGWGELDTVYEGVLDTNLVIPRGVDQTEVIFDFYFPDITSAEARERNLQSISVGQRIQDEDTAICKSVQRGLNSRAYNAGRLSVRREAGEHLFHRLLYSDLKRGLMSDEL